MTQRSILAGNNPTIVIKAGANVTVKGVDGGQVTAQTTDMWGLQVDKKSEAEFARARAVVGETVLFDLRFKRPTSNESQWNDVIEIQVGGSGEVQVPFGSNLKVYAGKDILIQTVRGRVDAYAGGKLAMQAVYSLGNASAGRQMDLDCETLQGETVEYKSGSDLRFHVQDLISAHIRVKDIGGFWEAVIGSGQKSILLKAGGDVTLVTDQAVQGLPPNYILGNIQKP